MHLCLSSQQHCQKPVWPRLQFYCSFCGCRSVSWCRCSILSEISGSLQLLAVDYGRLFTELIGEVSGVPSQPADLRELPSQAIECHMPTVMPSGTEWGTAAGDLIYNNLQYSYTLVAKACITMIYKRVSVRWWSLFYGVWAKWSKKWMTELVISINVFRPKKWLIIIKFHSSCTWQES